MCLLMPNDCSKVACFCRVQSTTLPIRCLLSTAHTPAHILTVVPTTRPHSLCHLCSSRMQSLWSMGVPNSAKQLLCSFTYMLPVPMLPLQEDSLHVVYMINVAAPAKGGGRPLPVHVEAHLIYSHRLDPLPDYILPFFACLPPGVCMFTQKTLRYAR